MYKFSWFTIIHNLQRTCLRMFQVTLPINIVLTNSFHQINYVESEKNLHSSGWQFFLTKSVAQIMNFPLQLYVVKLINFSVFFNNQECTYPLGICSSNFREPMFQICSNLTIKAPERRLWYRFGVFIANFEEISNIVPVLWLMTLNK